MKKRNSFISMITLIFAVTITVGCTPKKPNDENVSVTPETVTGSPVESDVKEAKKLSVYTSFYAMYDFTSKIGGDRINITNIVPDGVEPHDWEPVPSDIVNLEKADIFIYNGVGFEHWTDKVLGSLQNKELVVVETAHELELLEGNTEEENSEEDHGDFDPHVWLDPINAKKQMEIIKTALVTKDPQNKDFYEANYEKYAAEFDKLDQEFKNTLSPLLNKDIIVSHEAFGYLCKAYGLKQVGIEGLSPNSEPDPAKMSEIIKFAKDNKAKVIFFEELVSPKVAETIAKEIGAKTDVLNPLEGLNDEQKAAGDDYISIMRANLQSLKSALE